MDLRGLKLITEAQAATLHRQGIMLDALAIEAQIAANHHDQMLAQPCPKCGEGLLLPIIAGDGRHAYQCSYKKCKYGWLIVKHGKRTTPCLEERGDG